MQSYHHEYAPATKGNVTPTTSVERYYYLKTIDSILTKRYPNLKSVFQVF